MTDQNVTETSQNSTLPVGKILASARSEQGMTTDMIAARLCLTENYIKALEAGNFELLPGDTFVRGYLRNYADAVGLNGEELVRLYLEQQNLATREEEDRQAGSTSTAPAKPAIALVLVIGLIAIAIAVGMSMSDSGSETYDASPVIDSEGAQSSVESNLNDSESLTADEPETGVLSVANQTDVTVQGDEQAEQSLETLQSEEVRSEVTESAVESTEEVSADSSINALPTQTLEFSFMGDCWYQVIDGTGAKLAERTKGAGETSKLEGVPPFTITLGDSTVVELVHEGNIVDLSRFHERKSARLKLGQ